MARFIIKNSKLNGRVKISGSNNSALRILIASLLTREEVILKNIPNTLDTKEVMDIMKELGVKIDIEKVIRIKADTLKNKISKKYNTRTVLLFLAPLLSRTGYALLPPPNDKLGQKSYNLHLFALKMMGVSFINRDDGWIEARCKKLKGATIRFPQKTTGGTENVILAACLAKGRTKIINANVRPEIYDLVRFLNKLGADIKIKGSGIIEINPVKELRGGKYKIIPDSIEAMTFLIGALITKSRIIISNFPFKDLKISLDVLKESGVKYRRFLSNMFVEDSDMTGFEIATGTCPMINTDIQPILALLATQITGVSKITDIRFREKWQYIGQLQSLGARIGIEYDTIDMDGGQKLRGEIIGATDAKSGIALILGGLVCYDKTIIGNIEAIDRGYEKIDEKFKKLGANIIRE
jgi:UDP-N-acetylglucosamine 1-carboxyvinyltransferase